MFIPDPVSESFSIPDAGSGSRWSKKALDPGSATLLLPSVVDRHRFDADQDSNPTFHLIPTRIGIIHPTLTAFEKS
jgi:hypothetical protein